MSKKARISPRKSPKQQRSQGLVETILTATTRILTKGGYETATTNRVAEIAGVSIGSLYQYFPNKEALIGAVIDRTVEGNVRKVERELKKLGDEPIEEALRLIIRMAFEMYMGNRPLFRVMFEQAPRLERVQNIFRARRHIAGLLGALLESYGIHPRNRELTMFVLMNGALGVIQTAVFDFPEGVADQDMIDEIVRLVMGYLKELKNP
ncbi:MAG: TetR/AcrR family transcriptional regulator [Deltaproteobacteria bacterium]|nr:TetR/AcrR family transcriptional regulator [Deltaproteobacteria bacterium]